MIQTPIQINGKYSTVVTKLSNYIFNLFKQSELALTDENGLFLDKKIYFNRSESIPNIMSDQYHCISYQTVDAIDIPLEFYLEVRIMWISNLNITDYTVDYVNGELYNDTKRDSDELPLVCVYITADPDDTPKCYSQIAMLLRDTLRHEIEHMTQSGWNTKPGKYIKSDQRQRKNILDGSTSRYKYYLLSKEIPAMIQGMYMYAKKMRVPLISVIQRNFDKDKLTEKERETILKVWRAHLIKLGIKQQI